MNRLVVCLCAVTFAVAPFICSAALENVARGKVVVFLPVQPNYWGCKDADDNRQLTDGEYVTAPGQMWLNKGCVGWSNSASKPFGVKLDLGADTPISGFSWNIPSGSGSVAFPQALFVYVSVDGTNWAFAGDLLGKAQTLRTPPPSDGYSVYRAWTDDLPCHGRWVMFVVQQWMYAFTDEIEVYRGPDELLKEPFPEETVTDPLTAGRKVRFRLALLKDAEKSGAAKDPSIRREISAADVDAFPEDFRTVVPFNDLQRKIFAANAARLRAAGFSKPVLWTNNRWENLDPLTVPPDGSVGEKPVCIRMMRGEVRSATVNVLNPTDASLDCHVSVEGLPEDTRIECSEVVFTETAWFRCVSGALVKGKGGSVDFTVPAGTSKQVWISAVRPKGEAGVRRGVIRAKLSDGTEATRPIAVRVYDIDYPAEPKFHLGGWDYLNFPDYYKNAGALKSRVALQKDIGVDIAWGTASVAPANASFDAEGRLVSKLDFTKWDEWTRTTYPDAHTYAVFWAVKDLFCGEKAGTKRFNRMLREYFTAWGEHLRKSSFAGKRVLIHSVDEPRTAAQADLAILWFRAIRAAGCPEFLNFSDPLFPNGFNEKIDPAFWDLCDVICPQHVDEETAADLRAKGKEIWTYACIGPSRTFDPQTYYRLPAWHLYDVGGKAMCFWAFGCGGGSGDSWRAFAQPGIEYSPYFVSPTEATPSKQSEAMREAKEDYEYLSMLEERCGAARAKKTVRYVLDRYQVAAPDWDSPSQSPEERDLCDVVCAAILKELTTVPAQVREPSFPYRHVYVSGIHPVSPLEHRFDYGSPRNCHTFDWYFPVRDHFKDHPDWYSYRKHEGRRMDDVHACQFCLTNRELREAMKRRLLAFLEKDRAKAAAGKPPPRLYDISMNDNWSQCECEACAAATERRGASALTLDFVNDIASVVKDRYPDVIVTTFAYYYNEDAPKDGTRAAENVAVRLCNTRQNLASSVREEDNRYFRDRLTEWRKHCKTLYVWDYGITYTPGLSGLPFPNEFILQDKYRFYREANVKGILLEHEEPERSDMWDMKYSLTLALMNDVDLDVDAWLKDYAKRTYGAAGGKVLDYRRRLDAARRKAKAFIGWTPTLSAFDYITPDELAACSAVLDEAERTVKDDARSLANVYRARVGLDRLAVLRSRAGRDVPADLVRAARARLTGPWFDMLRKFPADPVRKTPGGEVRIRIERTYLDDVPMGDFPGGKDVVACPATSFWVDDSRIVDDPVSPLGLTLITKKEIAFDKPVVFRMENKDDYGLVAEKTYAQPLGAGYRWYHLGRGKIQFERNRFRIGDWEQMYALRMTPDLIGREADIWLSIRFDADDVRIDRLAFSDVGKGE